VSGKKGGREGPTASDVISGQPEPEAEGPEEISELSISVSPRGKAVVEKILKGRLGDFIPEQKIKNAQYVNREAIQIQFQDRGRKEIP
jgi:hypothetical protein